MIQDATAQHEPRRTRPTVDAAAIPYLSRMVHVDTYDECQEIFVTPSVFEVDPLERYSWDLWNDTLPIVNGDAHLRRRRYLAPIFSPSALGRYDQDILQTALDEWLRECGELADESGVAEIELIFQLKTMLVRVAAAYVGIDGIGDDRERAAELLQLIATWTVGTQARYSSRPAEEVVSEGMEALAAYTERFYEPSRLRREEMVRLHLAGRLGRDELPSDVITYQLLPAGERLWDAGAAVRETLPILAGGLHTTAASTARAVDEYLQWCEQGATPELDADTVRGLVNETLRLNPPVPYIVRRAVADHTLRSGRQIPAGTEIVLRIDRANVDDAVFGPDASEFRPDRYVGLPAQFPQYGLAFGAGPHLCIGRPLVTTPSIEERETRLPRLMNRILHVLIEHAVARPPASVPTKEESYRDIFKTYPVVLSRLATARPQRS